MDEQFIDLNDSSGAIASAEAFGDGILDLTIYGSGIESTENLPSPKLDLIIYGSAIETTENIPSPKLDLIIYIPDIESTETFGSNLTVNLIVFPSDIETLEGFGTGKWDLIIWGSGGVSAEAVGTQDAYRDYGLYEAAREAFLNANISWDNTIKVMLTKTGMNAYNAGLTRFTYLNQVDSYRYTGSTDATIGSKTGAAGVADGGDVSFSHVALSGSDQAISTIIYQDSGTNTTSRLIGHFDVTGFPFTPCGGTIIVNWDDAANKIFVL